MHRYDRPPTARYEQPMAPLIDNSSLPKPIMLKCDEVGNISVNISGFPKPAVRWQIGRRRVKESPKYQMKTDGKTGHTLVILRVTDELDSGVWVVANNDHGEDCCLLDVKTYSLLAGQRSINYGASHSMYGTRDRNASTSRIQRIPSVQSDAQSVMSLDTWKREMDIRNQMRSVDDLILDSTATSVDDQGYAYNLNKSFDPQSKSAIPRSRIVKRRRRNSSTTRLNEKVGHFSSTEAVSCEIQSPLIPPITMDSMQSILSIPGTPYQQRRLPNLQQSISKPVRTSSTIETEISNKGIGRRKRLIKRTASKSSLASACSVSTIDKVYVEAKVSSFGIVRIPSRSDIRTAPAQEQESQRENKKQKPVVEVDSIPAIFQPVLQVHTIPVEVSQPVLQDNTIPTVQITNSNDLWELLGSRLNYLCKNLLGGIIDFETKKINQGEKLEDIFNLDLDLQMTDVSTVSLESAGVTKIKKKKVPTATLR